MKKLFVIAAMAAFSFANAQKGTVLVAGHVGFSSEKSEPTGSEETTNSFEFAPKVGYQFHDNWTVGIEAGIGTAKSEESNAVETEENKVNAFSAGAFVRYTRPLTDIFSVFADLGVGFQNEKYTTSSSATVGDVVTSTSSTSKANGMYIGITPAVLVNVKNGFALNFSFGGLGYETMNTDDVDNSAFAFNFGQTVNIGISKNF